MQYILTEDEYSKLVAKASKEKSKHKEESLKVLQDLCTRVANNEPLKEKGNFSGMKAGEVWGCIITNDNEYCDDCPVEEQCPYESKEFSQ